MTETRAEKNKRLEQERKEAQMATYQHQLEVNPLRLLKLIARAEKYEHDGVSYVVGDGFVDPSMVGRASDPVFRVTFNFAEGYNGRTYSDNKTLYLFGNDDWEFASVEEEFDSIDSAKTEAERRLKVAQEAYDLLTPDQRLALKLTRRP